MGNPKKQGGRTTSKKVSSAKGWKKNKTTELEVPSGNVCLVIRKPLDTFLKEGRIPNPLLPIVMKAVGGDVSEDDLKAELNDYVESAKEKPEVAQDMITSMTELVDAVVIDCVLEPRVSPALLAGEEYDEDILYVDEVDMDDKMFIFNFVVGGAGDLERFREGQASVLEDLHDSGVDEGSPL